MKPFETILGIGARCHVARVDLKTEEKHVELWLEHDATSWPFPECGTVLTGFDHAEERLQVTPHVAQNNKRRQSAIGERTTRHPGYLISRQKRKRVEEIFGWLKTVGGLASGS